MTASNRIKLAVAIVALVIVITLIVVNIQSVTVHFLVGELRMPLALMLIVTLLIGVGIGTLGTWIYTGRRK